MIKEICSCVRGFEDLKGSAAECVDHNYGFCRNLNKTSFVDVTPTLGVNHVIYCVVVLCVVSIVFFHAVISIYLISKYHC